MQIHYYCTQSHDVVYNMQSTRNEYIVLYRPLVNIGRPGSVLEMCPEPAISWWFGTFNGFMSLEQLIIIDLPALRTRNDCELVRSENMRSSVRAPHDDNSLPNPMHCNSTILYITIKILWVFTNAHSLFETSSSRPLFDLHAHIISLLRFILLFFLLFV